MAVVGGRAKSKAKADASAITMRDGLVVVSYFLPVIVTKVEIALGQVESMIGDSSLLGCSFILFLAAVS